MSFTVAWQTGWRQSFVNSKLKLTVTLGQLLRAQNERADSNRGCLMETEKRTEKRGITKWQQEHPPERDQRRGR